MLARVNGAHVSSGNFQLWNANFFNIFRKDDALEVLIHQKYYTGTDLHDTNSFLLVVERISTSDLRTLQLFIFLHFVVVKSSNHIY